MKAKSLLLLVTATAAIVLGACQKQPSPEERQAEVDREVQRRLDAEHQVAAQQTLDQRQANLDARERALRRKEDELAATPTPAEPEETATPQVASADEPEDSYSTFYQKLDPYGAWIETSNYGYVFQPQVASRSADWRPYTDGHWVYTDAGWTWISSEPFGWATYHYGRWAQLRSVGWVWVPGDEWAPAWVAWRRGNDFVGWAPLPPEARFNRQTGLQNYRIGPEQFAFVPVSEFGGPESVQVIVPPARNVTIINQTTNVTNITYNKTIVVDRGPSYDDLRSRSRHQIPRLRLERSRGANAEQPVIRGDVVAMPVRDFRPAPQSARPPRVQRKITQPVVEQRETPAPPTPAKPRPRETPVATPRPTAIPTLTPTATATTPPARAAQRGVQRKVVEQRETPAPPIPAKPRPRQTPVATPPPTASPTPTPTPTLTPTTTATTPPPRATQRENRQRQRAELQAKRRARGNATAAPTPTP